MEDHSAAYAPPSPLSKFVHQQSQKQQQGGGFGGAGGGYVDYERVSTAQSRSPLPLPMPPRTGVAYPCNDCSNSYGFSSSGSQMATPPSRSSDGFNLNHGTTAASGLGDRGSSDGGMSHPFLQAASDSYGIGYGGYGGDATPASRSGTAAGGGYGGVGGNSNMGNRNVSSARQSPGGHSNWSPFS